MRTPVKKRKILSRKKTDPDKFIFTGDTSANSIDIQIFKYNEEECIEKLHVAPSEIEDFDSKDHCYWLNIYGLDNPEVIAQICKKFKVHDLVIQDILDVNQRPKYQEFDEFEFLTIKASSVQSRDEAPMQISFIFGAGFLITFQEKPAGFFAHIRTRLREKKGAARLRNSDYLLYTMLEAIMDDYFTILQQVESDIEEINMLSLSADPRPTALAKIEAHKKFANRIKKLIMPIKEFSHTMERGESRYIEQRHLKYFSEIQDLSLTLQESCDSIILSLESSTNLFFSLQSHRMNQVIQTLTIVTTIFIPITFIAGIYGMNFANIPELKWEYGYAMVWVLIIGITLAMLLFFRRKGWF